MKASFASLAAAVLLTAISACAAPIASHDGPGRRDDNYGYDRNHRVTPQERARWEAAHRNDRRDDKRRDDKFDRNKNYGFDRDHKVTRDERRAWEAGHNYGYTQNHRVTPQERARWEASYRR
jgi:Ni/Co efflux regulator RcnB